MGNYKNRKGYDNPSSVLPLVRGGGLMRVPAFGAVTVELEKL